MGGPCITFLVITDLYAARQFYIILWIHLRKVTYCTEERKKKEFTMIFLGNTLYSTNYVILVYYTQLAD